MRRLARAWVDLWDLQESASILAIVRILVGAVIAFDFAEVGALGLQGTLWASSEAGGFVNLQRLHPPLSYQILPATAATSTGMWAVTLALALAVMCGLYTRFSAIALVLVWAQLAEVLPNADRGIDMILRDVVLVLAFAPSARMWSVDAWRRTGHPRGDASPAPAWGRHLLVLQLVVLYFMAGVQKIGLGWTPLGGFSALYVILHDPSIARAEFPWLDAAYPLTQVATAVTMLFEWTAPLVLLVYLARRQTVRGRWATIAVRFRLHWVWLSLGVMLHTGIALTMKLGIFPWAMFALYPVFLHPDELPGYRRT
jgi:hypothetical protein